MMELLSPAGSRAALEAAVQSGADAVYIATSALMALGCHLCRSCQTGRCNWGIATQNPELVKQYGIRQAPTLVITDGAQVKKYVNASNIQKYVDEELD